MRRTQCRLWDTQRTGRLTPEREAEVIAAWLAPKNGKDKDGDAGGKKE